MLVALALLVLPVVGAVWGLWVCGTWLARRGTEQAPSTGRAVVAGCVAVASVLAAVTLWPAVFGGQDEPSAAAVPAAGTLAPAVTPTAAKTAAAAMESLVPNVIGIDLPTARQAVSSAGLRDRVADRSPRDRQIMVERNWTVVATYPEVGARRPARERITLLVLKNSEAAWFAAHPVMPQLAQGTPADDLISNGGPLFGVDELVLFRYANGLAPTSAQDPYDEPRRTDRGSEPAEETSARAGLKQAHPVSSLVVGSLPASGQAVRTGRLIVVTVKDAPKDPSTGSGKVYIPPVPNNDDDDVNVPGWLCPTRFC